jgi:hypothetical protein
MSGPSFTSPLRAAITTRHQESVKPRKITQTLANRKSLPSFINRKILKTKPQQQKKRKKKKKKKRKQQKQHTYTKQKKPRKTGSAPPPINRMKTKK